MKRQFLLFAFLFCILAVPSAGGIRQTIRLPAVSARYVRVSAEGGLPCGLMSVAEFDVR